MIHGSDATTDLMTAEQLMHVAIPGRSTELVRGRLVMREPPGTYHGRVQSNLNVLVGVFVREQALGAVFGQDTGFRIASDPDTVRAPDLSPRQQPRAQANVSAWYRSSWRRSS